MSSPSRSRSRWAFVVGMILNFGMIGVLRGEEPIATSSLLAAEESLDFDRDIRPILAENCFSCHGPDAEAIAADLRLDVAADAIITAENPDGAIRSGDPDQSPLVARIESVDAAERMPPPESHKELDAQEMALLRRWIREGAEYKAAWAFVAPQFTPPPTMESEAWSTGPIDRYVLAAMQRRGLTPSSTAERTTLIRRLHLDLLGLPPSPDEVDEFVADSRPDAWQRRVDRVLASPRFGERMAMLWLDLARYGDTNGYHADSDRPVWVWRDWVIDAYNANMPFDQFTIEQLAGDLLPEATLEQRVASGFNRNVRFNEEGGADPAEFLTAYAADRVITLGRVWLGLTLDCAQCHSHKYDPISQHEFYSLTAFFNSLEEVGAGGVSGFHGQPVPPVMRVLPERMRLEIEAVERQWIESEKAIDRALAAIEYRDPYPTEATLGEGQPPIETLSQAAWERAVIGQQGPPPPQPMAAWDFRKGVQDQIGSLHGELKNGATHGEQGLVLDGATAYAVTPAIDRELGGRTLEATVRLSTLQQAGGAAIALQTLAEDPNTMLFDAIVFGERQPQQWMAGSNFFLRTEDFGGESETEAADRFVTIAIVYENDGTIRAYRDGRPYGRAYRKSELQRFTAGQARVVFGARALPPQSNFMLSGTIREARLYDRPLSEQEVAAAAGVARYVVPAELEAILQRAPEERTESDRATLQTYYLREVHAETQERLRPLRERRDTLQQTLNRLRDEAQHPLQMVSVELPEPRPTHLLIRGDFQNPGEPVARTVPAFLPAFEPGEKPNRLTLARWLMQADQPLVARVQVNRFWQLAFGEGLVKTLGDFGRQGTYPTHPELLDAMALRFQQSGWDVKDSLRRIMVSQTYCQSSEDWRRHADVDPQNQWLWRSSRVRLSAESIRDNSLAIAGNLSNRLGGPPVFPYQPDDYYRDKNGGWRWNVSGGSDLYRRGLYTFWRRTTPYPSFVIFDAPDRAECTVSRPRTNTPLQALVTLNDPQYVEAARLFAERLLLEQFSDDVSRLDHAFRIAVSREPTPEEHRVLLETLEAERVILRDDVPQATFIATMGRAPRVPGLEDVEVAAWATVAAVILNMDETLNRE